MTPEAVISPTTDTRVEMNIVSNSNLTSVFSGLSYAYIEVISAPANVINTVDYLALSKSTVTALS
jgi:hypothetical protein